MNYHDYTSILKREIRPALGCTEPIAVALAVAKARETLGRMPESVVLRVSGNILKNAMGVGIPGTGLTGLEVASALSVQAGQSRLGLEVLSEADEADREIAKELARSGLTKVMLKDTDKKLYIEAELTGGGHTAVCVIEDTHTQITSITLDGKTLSEHISAAADSRASGDDGMTVAEIWEYVNAIPAEELSFLNEIIETNSRLSEEGLTHEYGLRVGRTLANGREMKDMTLSEYVCATAAAAADARMDGCVLPAMSTAGSGNQGLSASLPAIAAAQWFGVEGDAVLRAEALSQLITIHIKTYIGRLSPLCGCSIASAIGSSCAIVYLQGGTLSQIEKAIRSMIANISGMICDGAKAGCALKIASSLGAAVQCAQLALADIGADGLNGIVSDDIEATIRNLGTLGHRGMEQTDGVILDMMLNK